MVSDNMLNSESSFTKVPEINKERIISVGCGFQHTLLITGKGIITQLMITCMFAGKLPTIRSNLSNTPTRENW